jgi:hypothetical protein
MHGLTMRWSLADAPAGVDEQLSAYVADSSFERFSGQAGLRFKTWRMRTGQWFEGCYVFASDEERAEFQRVFTDGAGTSPVSQLVGSAPVLIEECEVVAVAEGGAGFLAAPRY